MPEETIIQAKPQERVGPGTRLNDLYEIDELIAVGGMGAVYRGHVIETGDAVAIKTIRSDFAGNANALTLFRKEAAALHDVHHGAVVRYYVFSIDRRVEVPYLAMEYVTGESLADRLKRGSLDFAGVDLLRRRIADGLHAAHEAGIIHRDISPDNVILPAGDPARAKIIDFGIARTNVGQTVIGEGFAGKYSYVSPEQLGLHGGDVTARSDIYSLGLVLAEASRGRPIDMGASPVESIRQRSKVPDLEGVDARLVPLLESMLRPDPCMRPQSMADVAAWTPAPPRKPSGGRAEGTGGARRRGLVVGAGAAGLAAAAGVTILVFGLPSKEPAPDPTPVLSERTAPQRNPASSQMPETGGASVSPGEARIPEPSGREQVQPASPPAEVPRADADGAATAPSVPDARPAEQERMASVAPNGGTWTPPSGSTTMEQVAAYVRAYRGGDCFFLSPTAISGREATIEAYGAGTAPFVAFDSAFKDTFGFEAKIQLRQVDPGQCPVVQALAEQAQAKPASVPKFRIENDHIRSGEALKGVITLNDDRSMKLLLVEGDGSVHDLAPYMQRSGRQAAFSVRLEAGASDRERPQLLVAVTARGPIAAVEARGAKRSETVFAQIAQEAARPGSAIALAAHYVKVGN